MRSNGHYSNGLPGGGFLRRVPFWLGAVIVSFVPTKILSTIEYLLVPSQGVGSLILDEALVLSLIMLYFLYAITYIAPRMDRLSAYPTRGPSVSAVFRVMVSFRQAVASSVDVPGGVTVGVGTFRARDLILLS